MKCIKSVQSWYRTFLSPTVSSFLFICNHPSSLHLALTTNDYFSFLSFHFILIRTFNMRYILLSDFKCIMQTISTILSRSLEFIHLAALKLHTCWLSTPCFPSPQSLATTTTFSASMSLTLLDISCTWNLAVLL